MLRRPALIALLLCLIAFMPAIAQVTTNSSVTGVGSSVNLHAPGPIGDTTADTITGTTVKANTAFTTGASASSTIQFGASVNDLITIAATTGTMQLATNATGTKWQLVADGSLRLASDGYVGFNSGTNLGAGSLDTFIVRDAANTVALKNSNNPQTFNHYAGNGGFMSVVAFNESLTIAAAATTDSATTIPAGAQIIAASVRVTTVIPTAATFTVTTATGGTALNTAAVSTAANSTDPGTAAGGATYTSAGTKIRITPNLTPGTATGVVRINGYYRIVTPPTS